MEIINSKFPNNLNINEDILKDDSCFLDIETTGLNRNKDIIYLIGILYYNKEEDLWTLTQIFATSRDKEKELLLRTIDLLSNFNKIINYNGNSFDIPFINRRLEYHCINQYICKDKSLDIYSIVRSNKNILDLENMKLETIEEYLGIYRDDIYSGKDCIEFYKEYLKTNDKELKDRILKHNYDDLYYLLYVVEIIDVIEKKKTINIVYNHESINFVIDTIENSKDFLAISGSYLSTKSIKQIFYGEKYKLIINKDSSFEFSIEVQKGLVTPEKTCLFINTKEYPLGSLIDESLYNLPEGIVLLRIESIYVMENIKNILSSLVEYILQ